MNLVSRIIETARIQLQLAIGRRAVLCSHRTHAFLVPFAGVLRLEFRFLAGRDEMRVLLEILDDLFRHNLSLETAECILDRFVRINRNVSHNSFTPSRQKILLAEQTTIKALFI